MGGRTWLNSIRSLAAAAALLASSAPVLAAPVAIDTLSVDSVHVILSITGDGTFHYNETIAPPADVVMGAYQDPIASGTNWKIYTTGAFGQPAPSGTVDSAAGTIDVNLSSLRGEFTLGSYGTYDFALWPLTTPPSGGTTYDGSSGAFGLSWTVPFSFTTSGLYPFAVSGNLSVDLGGSVSAVPIPAAVWLFASGLLGLAGLARRRFTS